MLRILLILMTYFPPDGWEPLTQVKVDKQYDKLLGQSFDRPIFSDNLRELEGKVITIEGYIIPIQHSINQDYFILSRFPYQSCFFCGNAGPETVAEVYTRHQVADPGVKVRVTGKLSLNDQDPLHLFFLIEDALVEALH